MAHTRKEFSDIQKSQIYMLDHATCAFSGISLWLLDNGIKRNWQMDWVDHVKPSAKGGEANIDNGVCASDFFNAKKRQNSSDNKYLVFRGKVTKNYIDSFGLPEDKLISQLSRLSNLNESDWFFNRTISGVFNGIDRRCYKNIVGVNYSRDDQYWFNAGWKKFKIYLKRRTDISILERGLVKTPLSFGSDILLELEKVNSEKTYQEWIELVASKYYPTSELYFKYFSPFLENKEDLLDSATSNQNINPELIKSLQEHFKYFNSELDLMAESFSGKYKR